MFIDASLRLGFGLFFLWVKVVSQVQNRMNNSRERNLPFQKSVQSTFCFFPFRGWQITVFENQITIKIKQHIVLLDAYFPSLLGAHINDMLVISDFL